MTSRCAVLAAGFLLFASSVVAGESYEIGPTVGQLLADVHRAQSGPRMEVVRQDLASFAMIIPAAGNAPGAYGTYFRSDLTLMNNRSTSQRVAIGYLQAGANNCNAPTTIVQFNNAGWRIYEDVVAQLGKNGVGALLITGVTSSGAVDSQAKLDAFSRIHTPMQNSSRGKTSQQFAGFRTDDLTSSDEGFIIGLRQDADYRTNLGLVNLDSVAHNFTATIYGTSSSGLPPTPTSVTVQPCSLSLGSIPPGSFGPLLIHVVPQGAGPLSWLTFGSSTDNTTGDGWTVHGVSGN